MKGDAPVPYLRGKWYWVRVPQLVGGAVRQTLGTGDLRRAKHYCTMLAQLELDGRWSVLHALGQGQYTAAELFEPWRVNQLDRWLLSHTVAPADPDLEPLVAQWFNALHATKPAAAAVYLRQLRTLIPEGAFFGQSQFTRPNLRVWLDGRPSGSRNRYRAAASSFAQYLCELEMLDANVVLSVKAAPQGQPRVRYLSSAEAQRVIAALPAGAFQALHALLLATGGDVSGALAIHREDLNLETEEVRIPGTKTHTRDRVRRFLVPWAWELVRAYWHTLVPGALAFPFAEPSIRLGRERARWALVDALTTCKLKNYNTKDHRHTFAVQALRDGYSYAVVAWQLGHTTTALAHRVYGNHVVEASDYVRRVRVTTEL